MSVSLAGELDATKLSERLASSRVVEQYQPTFWYDVLFERLFGAELYRTLKQVFVFLIDFVEQPGQGSAKKAVVIGAVIEFLVAVKALPTTMGWLQRIAVEAVLGFMLESVLAYMKKLGWNPQSEPAPESQV